MRHPSLLLSVLLLGACTLISPYSITFTNASGEVVDPETSTLDFVVSAPTLAYISGVSCEGAEPMEIFPVNKEMEVSTVHNLPLTILRGQPAGAECEVTVTAYDKTTTEQSSATIDLVMTGTPLAGIGEMCGGIAGIMCEENLVCQMEDSSVSDASGTCVESTDQAPELEVEDATTEVEDATTVESTEPVETSESTDEVPAESTETSTTPES